ncbi:MAG: TGS domain-containing protein [archaeon]|nr:TGS domain-containing protein [archaeon]
MEYKNYSIEQLLTEASKNNSSNALKTISEAFETAKKNQTPKQLQSQLNSAMILALQELDDTSICSALLFGAFNSGTEAKFFEKTSKETIQLLEQCKKINEIIQANKAIIAPEKLAKIVLAIAKDIRSIFVMLALELEQLRHYENLSEKEQIINAEISLKLFVPITHKLGLDSIKWELEDLAFKIINQKDYEKIQNKFKETRNEREQKIEEILKQITGLIAKHNIKAKVFGRPKSFYSIFQKIKKKNLAFEQINDLNALRVICNSEKDCYSVLGLLHSQWDPVQEEFDDYIANPKTSGYKSIHAYFKQKNNEIFEVQIRTWEMHIEAEEGLAAHWAYKKFLADPYFDPKLKWAKNILQWFKKTQNSAQILSSINLQFEHDKVFVLTPKHEIIELPKDSTPIDFGFAVHSTIGEKAVKAIVNGKIEKLDHKLQNGDVVSIVTSPHATIQRSWLNSVQSSKAKTKIRQILGITGIVSKTKETIQKHSLIQSKKKILTAKCCSPLPGEEVIGIQTTKRKIIVHRKLCENLKKIDKKKLVELDWGIVSQKDFEASISIEAIDRLNLLNDLMKAISKTNTKISSTNANISGEIAKSSFKLSVKNQKEMDKLIENLSRVKGVIKVERE